MTTEPDSRPQIESATRDAIEALRRDVFGMPFTADMTVQQVLRRVNASDAAAKALSSADQRGGPRWKDGQTCEVRLELSGSTVAEVIEQAAAKHPKELGLSADTFKRALAHLKRQTFSVLGVSSSAGGSDETETDRLPRAWQAVSADVRAEAVNSARSDAAAGIVQSIRAVPLTGGKTMDDALANPEVARSLRTWLAAQPCSNVQFRDDMQVRVTLSTPPEQLWSVVKTSLDEHRMGPALTDSAGWARLRTDFERSLPSAMGRAGVTSSPATAPTAFAFPKHMPDWVSRQMDADGHGMVGGLKGAREAEAAAVIRLRSQVEALTLSPGFTLGDAARQNPKVDRAITDALAAARISKMTYLPDGVNVRMSLDLEILWRRIKSED